MTMLFATTYPERVAALVLYGTYAKRVRDADYPWAPTDGAVREFAAAVEREGGGPAQRDSWAPRGANEARFKERRAKYLRPGASPAAARAALDETREPRVRS